jgi:hypothetical protein
VNFSVLKFVQLCLNTVLNVMRDLIHMLSLINIYIWFMGTWLFLLKVLKTPMK